MKNDRRIVTFFALVTIQFCSIANASSLWQGSTEEIANDIRPQHLLACPQTRDAGWFKFVSLDQLSLQKTYDRPDACRLVSALADDVYGSLATFWPLKYNLGVEVTVENDRNHFNDFFNSNLLDPSIQPSIGLVYIPGISVEPQVSIWTHEYGHAVLDEYLRGVLEQRLNFRQLALYFKAHRSQSQMSKEISMRLDRLTKMQQQESITLQKLYQSERSAQALFDSAQNKLSSLLTEQNDLSSRIRHLQSSIYDSWFIISREQGGDLSNYPEGKKILDSNPPPAPRGLQALIVAQAKRNPPNPVVIKNELNSIATSKSEISQLRPRLQAIAQQSPNLNQLQAATEATRKLVNDENSKIVAIEGEKGQINVEAGLAWHKRLVEDGMPTLPGLSIYNEFNEFFADLFSVVFHNDANAIGNSLLSIDGSTHPEMADARRFAPLHPELYAFESWVPRADDKSHMYFAPVRAALGGEFIHRLNQQGNQKLFLTKVLDLIASQMIEYSNQADDIIVSGNAALVQQINDIKTSEEMGRFLSQVSNDFSLTTSFFSMSDLDSWCKSDFKSCQKNIVEQLQKGRSGAFSVSIPVSKANINLYNGITKVIKDLPRH